MASGISLRSGPHPTASLFRIDPGCQDIRRRTENADVRARFGNLTYNTFYDADWFDSAGVTGGGVVSGLGAGLGEARSPAVVGDAGTVPASGLGGAAASGDVAPSGLGAAGLGGGLGFSGLMPPSQCGPEYISAAKSPSFHLASKSAAALFTVSPTPTNRFHGYTVGAMEQESPSFRRYNPIGLPR